MSMSMNDDRTGDRYESPAGGTSGVHNANERDDAVGGDGLLPPPSGSAAPDSSELIDIWIDDVPVGPSVEQIGQNEEVPGEATLGEGLDLGSEDELICTLLSKGWTHDETAKEVGCSTKTVQRRVGDPLFAAEVRRRGKADVAATTAKLFQLGQAATDGLSGLLSSEDERVRLQAIRTVLEFVYRRYRVDVMEAEWSDRLAILEETLGRSDEEYGGGRR